jgi:hypothetical protein
MDGSVTSPPSSVTPCRNALMIPCVTLDRRPSGLPIAIARSPTLSLDESAKDAGLSRARVALMTARSSGGNAPTSFAPERFPFDVVTVNEVPPLTTWLFVTMSPVASTAIPDPRPC